VQRPILVCLLLALAAACQRAPEPSHSAAARPPVQPPVPARLMARNPDQRTPAAARGAEPIRCKEPVASIPC